MQNSSHQDALLQLPLGAPVVAAREVDTLHLLQQAYLLPPLQLQHLLLVLIHPHHHTLHFHAVCAIVVYFSRGGSTVIKGRNLFFELKAFQSLCLKLVLVSIT